MIANAEERRLNLNMEENGGVPGEDLI
jgi:hypothetical protein